MDFISFDYEGHTEATTQCDESDSRVYACRPEAEVAAMKLDCKFEGSDVFILDQDRNGIFSDTDSLWYGDSGGTYGLKRLKGDNWITDNLMLPSLSVIYGQNIPDVLAYSKYLAQYVEALENAEGNEEDRKLCAASLLEADKIMDQVKSELMIPKKFKNIDEIMCHWQEARSEIHIEPVHYDEVGVGLGVETGLNSKAGSSASTSAFLRWAAYIEGNQDAGNPLVISQGRAQWNMVGASELGGAYTGLSGNFQVGVGGQFKGAGEQGSAPYVLAIGALGGEAYYHNPYSTEQNASLGLETGILGQVGGTIWTMSPLVQLGETGHYTVDENGYYDTAAQTGYLQYGGRARLIVDHALFASAEAFYSPNMSDALPRDDGTGWESAQAAFDLDCKYNKNWNLSLYYKATGYWGEPASFDGKVIDEQKNGINGEFIEHAAGAGMMYRF